VSTVGIYDADWLLTPEFERMLDLMISSPGGIRGIRFFGLLSCGTPERLQPETGGSVWTDPDAAPDFTLPFAALDALTSRNLTPFVALGFFPPAISLSPIAPPPTFEAWRRLVATFLAELAADARFGPEAIASWRFEVWNEPNEGRFWSGSFEQYLDLYRATSDAVRDSGLTIRLGGPAMAYKPESEADDGPETMRRFLTFLRDEADVQCDFISYHRKGTVDRSPPDPRRLWDASAEVERLVQEIVPERAQRLEIINNEADEKIGFETPFPPRMDAYMASWLTTLLALSAHHASNRRSEAPGHSFFPDNANLQLIEEPFDGRRSIFVPVSNEDRSRLVKTPGAIWYDLLPFLNGKLVHPGADSPSTYPDDGFHLLAVRSEESCTVLATWFPPDVEAAATESTWRLSLTGCPWTDVNVIEYRIDSMHSNSYRTAGGGPENPAPIPALADLPTIRLAQELTFERLGDGSVAFQNGSLQLDLTLEPYATVCVWITPVDDRPIAAPANVAVRQQGADIDVVWDPVEHPHLLGYDVERIAADGSRAALTLRPIRPTLVTVDANADAVSYRVRAVSASNVTSSWSVAENRSGTTVR
jgi:hypothetical protein